MTYKDKEKRKQYFRAYYIKNRAKILKSQQEIYKKKRAKKAKETREIQTKIIKKEGKLKRLSIAINFPKENKYYGALLQLWKKTITQRDIENGKEILLRHLTKFLQYSQDDLWFDFHANLGIGVQNSDNLNYQNIYEIRIENNTGRIVNYHRGIWNIK